MRVRATNMGKTICITNRHLVKGDFYSQIEMVLKKKPDSIILREKDLDEKEYAELAKKISAMCDKNGTELILHNFYNVAIELGIRKIHLPLFVFEDMAEEDKKRFDKTGVSCHSVEEARKAESLGASYITAGHIFATDCKKGLEPRGIKFLENVCASVDIPVYAIGGINDENRGLCIEAGAAGVCIMSGFMRMKG